MSLSLRYYLIQALSRVPLLILMLMLDLVFFKTLLGQGLANLPNEWIYNGFWSIHGLIYFILLTMPPSSQFARDQPIARDFRALLMGVYISKFLSLLLFLAGALVFGAFLGINQLLDLSWNAALSWQIIRILSLVAGTALFIALCYGMIRNRYRFQLRSVEVPIAGLPAQLDGFTIVQFSDAHLGSISKPASIRPGIALINEQQADLVCFTGDLVNNVAEEARPFVRELTKIQAKHGVVAILGNHDYGDYVRWPNTMIKEKNLEELVELQRSMNWRLLRDESMQLEVEGETISIIGVENISGKGRFKNYGNLGKAYPEADNSVKILLTHDPSHWRSEVLDYKDITLSLSGHTHGMQFGLEWGNWLKWSPVKWVYKEWAGLYQEGEQYLYVNRGFGFLGYPGRVGILPEITRIELKSKIEE